MQLGNFDYSILALELFILYKIEEKLDRFERAAKFYLVK